MSTLISIVTQLAIDSNIIHDISVLFCSIFYNLEALQHILRATPYCHSNYGMLFRLRK